MGIQIPGNIQSGVFQGCMVNLARDDMSVNSTRL